MSQRLDAKTFAGAVRAHGTIENSPHWQLDVAFGEDRCRVRTALTAATALERLKNEAAEKIGVKNQRLAAACNTRSREKALTRA